MSFCLCVGAALCDASALQCAASVPEQKALRKKLQKGTARGAAPKNAGAMEDFWELRGLVFLAARSLEADTFTGFLFQFLMFGVF